MDLYIITGTTKGLGQSLAKLVLSEGHLVLSISRKKTIVHANFNHLNHDLSKIIGLENKLVNLLKKMNLKKVKAIHLINNAAVINPIGPVSEHSLEALNSHIQINLIAPIFLTGIVAKFFKRKKIPKVFTNISSGAANKPINGWAIYCSAKSGLKMFTECMVNEMRNSPDYKFLDFCPGVMDTDMQVTIRKKNSKSFERVHEFIELKANNMLLPPSLVAEKLLSILNNPHDINKTHYDVKECI